jgi:hypothetical protein
MEGLGLWLSIEFLLTVRRAQKNTPAFARAHDVVCCIETRRLLLAPFDVPGEVHDSEVLALGDEREWLELGRNVAVFSIELAKRDHVLTDRLKRWPVHVARSVRDARRDSV